MNDSAVAATCGHSELGELLDKKDILPTPRKCLGDGASHNATPDDENIDAIHDPVRYARKTGSRLVFFVADFVEESFASLEARFRPVMHGKLRAFVLLVAIFPER